MRHTLGRFVAVLAGLALLAGAPAAAGAARASALAGAGVSAAAAAAPNATWWRPRLGYKFQYTLKFPFDMAKHVKPGVQVYLIDGFDNTAETVAAMHGAGLLPVCYFSAGSYEDWRTDKGEFNASDYMNALSGWDGEYWIDVRSANVKRIMRARMEMCKAKGFVAVDPDNVDGYSNKNGIGFGAADQLAYNKWLAATAHELGLGAGLKNDLGQIDDLVADFDFFVNEQCQDYDECQLYLPAKTAGKPVWNVEYKKAAFNKACEKQLEYGIRSLYKADPNLSDDWQECQGVTYPDADPDGGGGGGGGGAANCTANGTANGTWWAPACGALGFQYAPRERFDAARHILPDAKVYFLDGATTPASAVADLRARGLVPVCYFSAGTGLRPGPGATSGRLVAGDYGRRYKGREYYVDIISPTVRGTVQDLLSECAAKGFAAAAPDNLDTYGRRHGLVFEAAEQRDFNRWIAATAHGLGLGVGLTNDFDQVAELAASFDFFVARECARRRVCEPYAAAKQGGKPVFQMEISAAAFKRACACRSRYGAAAIRKKATLQSWRQTCDAVRAPAACPDA